MTSQSGTGYFVAETGVNVPAVTSEQMRELDRIAVEETGPSLLQMMENAGRNLALLAMELIGPRWKSAKIVILAGGGGNGGGGICTARHLSNHGVSVGLCLAAPDGLSEAAVVQRKIFQFTDGNEVKAGDLANLKPDLIIDALIGYGLKAAPRGTTADLIAWANTGNIPILSLDIPSGIDATTGRAPGEFIRPTWTMTLALPKSGFSRKPPANSSSPTSEFLLLVFVAWHQATFRPTAIDFVLDWCTGRTSVLRRSPGLQHRDAECGQSDSRGTALRRHRHPVLTGPQEAAADRQRILHRSATAAWI